MPVTDRFLRACRRESVDVTPVWFMRQAGRYMADYPAVRRHHSILEICKTPELAAEVTVTAAEKLGVDAAIIFADLLLPAEPMGLKLEFRDNEGPVITPPVRDRAAVDALPDDLGGALGYVSESIRKVAAHFQGRIPVIGFAGAPFTLASYLIEGGASRSFLHTKQLMYREPATWDALMNKLCSLLAPFLREQVAAGARALQLFDSWVGTLGEEDFRHYVLPYIRSLVDAVQRTDVPVIYFSTGTSGYPEALAETGAAVISLDWRAGLAGTWERLSPASAVQGNLDPVTLFAPERELRRAVQQVLRQAGSRPGHIFNLGHGILPGTPVEQVRAVVEWVHDYPLVTA